MRTPRSIPQVDSPPPARFRRQWVEGSRPVIVRGLLEDWPARHRWSLDDVRSRFGDARVPVMPVVDGVVQIDPRRGLVTAPTPLSDLLDEMRDGRARSYMMARLDQLPAGLQAEVGAFPYVARAPWRLTKVWCSTAGTRSALHFDINDNLHAAIVGRKRFTLFSPADRDNLYPARLLSGVPNASRLDLDELDLGRFPRAARAQPWVGELGPGETLLIPRGWWHHVVTLEPTISVNTWWATGLRLPVVAAAGAFKRLYGISR